MKGLQNFAALNLRSVSSQNLRQNVCGGTDLGEVEIDRTADAVIVRLRNFKPFAGLVGPLHGTAHANVLLWFSTQRSNEHYEQLRGLYCKG